MAATHSGRTLRELVRVLAGRSAGIAVILVVIVAAAALATRLAPRVYRSEATLMGSPGERFNPLEDQSASMRDRLSLFVMAQRQIITSDYVLASALLRLQGVAAEGDDDARRARWDAQVEEYVRTDPVAVRQLRERTKVLTPGGPEGTFTQIFSIRVDWPEERAVAAEMGADSRQLAAARAHDVTRYLVEAYLGRYRQLERRRMRDASDFLMQESLLGAKKALDEASAALRRFIVEELKGDILTVVNMVGDGVGGETGPARLSTTFAAEIHKIDEQLAEAAALQKAVDAELAKKDAAAMVAPDAVTTANKATAILQEKIVSLKLKLNELEPRFTESYQELKNVRAELAAAQQDLKDQLARHGTRLSQQIAVLQARRQTLSAKVAEDRKTLESVAGKAAAYKQLVDARDSAQEMCDIEQRRAMNAATAERLAALSHPVLVTTLEEPSRPDPAMPQRPRVWLNLLVAAVGAVLVALVYAFLADHFDHSIKSVDEAERLLEAPVLASVPRMARPIVRLT